MRRSAPASLLAWEHNVMGIVNRTEVIDGHKVFKVYADSVQDAAQYLEATESKWGRRASYTDQSSGHSWDFGLGAAGTLELAKRGWSEGALDLSNRLSTHLPNRDHVDSWRYDVAGELPDIGRFLAGDPANMRRHGHPKGHRPIISIFCNNWISARIDAQQMANYGAALVAMVDQIENTGRRVEVIAGTVAQRGGFGVTAGRLGTGRDVFAATWKIKGAEDPVDLAALAFSLAHPAASRRFGWALWTRSEAEPDSFFGFPLGMVDERWLWDTLPGTYIMKGLQYDHTRCRTLDDALKYVSESINEAAGEQLVTAEG